MKFTKLEIAEKQMETALRLFFEDKDYISSITLAGASDEILGKIREQVGERNEYEHLKELLTFVHKEMFKEIPSEKDFNTLMNGVRNGLKHRNGESEMNFDPEQEAVNILDRVVVNYYAITGHESALMKQFKEHCMKPQYPINGYFD